MNHFSPSHSVQLRRPRVIAVHCSGGDARQWEPLKAVMGEGFALTAVNLYGTAATGPWRGEGPFTLADEAKLVVDAVAVGDGPVHLVGHSYGGAVAMRAAFECLPRVASITLYEPMMAHLLRDVGAQGEVALAEAEALAHAMWEGVLTGHYAKAAKIFVDYWSGPGAWANLRPVTQAAVMRWLPKAPLEFRAVMMRSKPLVAYRYVKCPVLVMRGEHAGDLSALMAEKAAGAVRWGQLAIVPGAGHMGPITHAEHVNAAIVRHILETEGVDERALCAA